MGPETSPGESSISEALSQPGALGVEQAGSFPLAFNCPPVLAALELKQMRSYSQK